MYRYGLNIEFVQYIMYKKRNSIFEIRARRSKDSFDVQLKEIHRLHLILTRVSSRLKEMVHNMHKLAFMR